VFVAFENPKDNNLSYEIAEFFEKKFKK
jgi:hypothetical protein